MLKVDRLSIIIPAFNEENTIIEILERVTQVHLEGAITKEIIVVDDCSNDRTGEVVCEWIKQKPATDVQYHRHQVNRGKGAAVHTGIKNATGECLVVQDADLEYDPREYNLLLKPVVEGFADVVYGSRFVGGNPHRILFFLHTVGNRLLTLFSNLFTNLNLTDMETCYKLFKTDLIQSIDLREERFGFEPEVTAKIARLPNVRLYEVGISYYGRTYQEGKKINWKDGFRALYYILKYNIFCRKNKVGKGIAQTTEDQ